MAAIKSKASHWCCMSSNDLATEIGYSAVHSHCFIVRSRNTVVEKNIPCETSNILAYPTRISVTLTGAQKCCLT